MIKRFPNYVVLAMILLIGCWQQGMGQDRTQVKKIFEKITFTYDIAKGLGHEKGVTRRDPSDIIKVRDTWYLWYTKVYWRSPGYWGNGLVCYFNRSGI